MQRIFAIGLHCMQPINERALALLCGFGSEIDVKIVNMACIAGHIIQEYGENRFLDGT